MTLKKYLIFMSLATAVSWGAWNYVIWAINPEVTNWIGFGLFYFSLFVAVTGTAAVIGFIIRFAGLKQDLAFKSVKEAFRQSFLFSALIIASLILLSRGLFTWLNLFLLVIALSILEFLLISYKNNNKA